MKRFLPLIIPIIASLIISFPFFQSGYFASDDGQWAVIRLADMKRTLRDGQFPARWSEYLNHGYGYPVFNFAYPLPYYLGALISGTGPGLVVTIKILFVLSVLLSGIGMYLLVRELGGLWPGVIASVLYVSAPFRLVDLYQRGSLGESLAFAVFPFLCYAGVRYILEPSGSRMVACAALFAAMIMTHNALAFLFLPFWLIFLCVVIISYSEHLRRYSVRYLLPMILLGLGLSAFFWVPALMEKQLIALSQQRLANPGEHTVAVRDYLYSPWFSEGKRQFALGWVHIVGFVISMLTYVFSGAIDRKKYRTLCIFLVVGLFVCLFLTTRDSVYLWENTALSSVDFPWRLLPVIVFFLSLATVFIGIYKFTVILGCVVAAAAMIWTVSIGIPIERIDSPDEYYFTNDATTTSADELMPVWVKEKPTDRPAEKVVVVSGQSTLSDISFDSRSVAFRVSALTPSVVRINTIYYPGWRFTIDEKPVDSNYRNPQGVMELDVSNGSHDIVGTFSETPLRQAANGVSAISIVLCGIILIRTLVGHVRQKREVSVESGTGGGNIADFA